MNQKSIPGWTTNIDEISNGVFKVILTDAYGRKAEIVDNATDETIERTIANAFDIEKQISKNWSLFLYELCVQKLGGTEIKIKEYSDKGFGSWFVQKVDKRLIYDNKESWLTFQTKSKDYWTELEIIRKEELKYSSFVRLIKMFMENT